jgi:uncharacterized protein YdeI (YjbR/CyaY-like superfamily)
MRRDFRTRALLVTICAKTLILRPMGGRFAQRNLELLTVETAAEWRAWLRANHRSSSGVRVVFFKKHTGKPCPTYDEVVEEALCWGWIDSVKQRVDDERYTFKLTPRKPRSNWSPSNKRRVARLLASGRMDAAGRALVDAAKADGSWDRKTAASLPATPPPELTSALATSRAARAAFDGLPPSHRRQYAQWIASAKRPETRERRASRAVDMLERGERLGM